MPQNVTSLRSRIQRGVTLIEDDVYGDLGFENRRPSTCKGLMPQADILYCSSFSKTLSPGLRIGWVAAGEQRRERIEYLKYVTSIASPRRNRSPQ